MKSNDKLRICPACTNLLERIDEDMCNHMKCCYCAYEFCWLCMSPFSEYHFSFFNTVGCPGMKYSNQY